MENKNIVLYMVLLLFMGVGSICSAEFESEDRYSDDYAQDDTGAKNKEGGQSAKFAKGANLVKISEISFVFVEAQGTLESDFANEFNQTSSYVSQYGLSDRKKAVLFLDTVINRNSGRYKIPPSDEKNPNTITKEYLYKQYGKPFFEVKRKALVGILIMPNESVQEGANIKIHTFKKVSAYVMQIYFKGLSKDIYTIEDKMLNRASMINYINSYTKKPYETLGMMEVFDTQTDTYIYIDMPGNKEQFISDYRISGIMIEEKPQNKDSNTTIPNTETPMNIQNEGMK